MLKQHTSYFQPVIYSIVFHFETLSFFFSCHFKCALKNARVHLRLLLRYSVKVVKAAAQVLNTLWQYRDLRTIYKKVRKEGFQHCGRRVR